MITAPHVGSFVTVSGIAVPADGAGNLETAMPDRLGLADDEPGFSGLQVWRPVRAAALRVLRFARTT